MNNTIKSVILAAIFCMAGCKDKGQDFIGHWEGQGSAQRTSLDISYSDGIYHVNYNSPDPVFGTKQETSKLEGEAMSESVLKIRAPLGEVTMRMEGDIVTLDDHTFRKLKQVDNGHSGSQ